MKEICNGLCFKRKKAKIVEAFKSLSLPKPWKITFSVDNHSTIVATIHKAPVSVINDYIFDSERLETRLCVNQYFIEKSFQGETLEILEKIKTILNTDNFNNSDVTSDYFHVGHYISIDFGRWNKPCEFI